MRWAVELSYLEIHAVLPLINKKIKKIEKQLQPQSCDRQSITVMCPAYSLGTKNQCKRFIILCNLSKKFGP